ncbi:MAG: hypothetical protein ACYTDY_20180, partial [Planctomycetota bacterium]
KLPDNASDTARAEFGQAILRLLVETCVARKDLDGARAALAKLATEAGKSESVWQRQLHQFAVGFLRLAEGKAAEAEAALSKSSTRDPRVLFYLAEAKAALGKREEAARFHRRVTEWNAPGLSHALVHAKAKARLAE